MIVDKLAKVGLEEQDKEREYFIVEEPIFYKNEEIKNEKLEMKKKKSHILVLPKSKFYFGL